LKNLREDQAFLTIENYVILQEQLWFRDHYDYVHDGCRIDNSNLLNTHCFSSARLQELCQARFKVRDMLECIIDFKLIFDRILSFLLDGRMANPSSD